MVSAEGEAVPLRNFVARGDEVEQWFKDLEEAMKGSLKTVFRNAALKYDSDDMQRRDWVLQWPCQVVLGLDAVFWTKITEENYLGPDADGDLYDWFEGN
jgi:dynein heavy chain